MAYVWRNIYNTLSVSDSEHGHYDSELVAIFDTREEAEEFCINQCD